MSLPQRPLLPNSHMDDKSPRLPGGPGSNGYPFAPFCATSSPSTTTASVFPQMPLFPPNFQQVYHNLMQAHLLQMATQAQAQVQARLSAGTSPVNSDQASSRSESPQIAKKTLILDEDGFATCPACGDKLAESQWNSHIEEEKMKLINHIRSVKENGQSSSNGEHLNQIHKRENELLRIKNNQQKRQILKRGTNSSLIRDCLTPFSRQSNDETGSSESPDTKKTDDDFNNMMKCTSCQQPCAYGIIMSSYDRPKCQMCFDIIRTQSCILTSTSPAQNDDENDEPSLKKMRFEEEIIKREDVEENIVDQ